MLCKNQFVDPLLLHKFKYYTNPNIAQLSILLFEAHFTVQELEHWWYLKMEFMKRQFNFKPESGNKLCTVVLKISELWPPLKENFPFRSKVHWLKLLPLDFLGKFFLQRELTFNSGWVKKREREVRRLIYKNDRVKLS